MAKFLITVLFFFCFGLHIVAQGNGLLRRPVPEPEYVLGPGDQLVLRVTDMEEVADKPIRVDPSGFVDLPLAGRIQAAGKNLTEFKAEVVTKLGKYITSPEVSVNLVDSGSQPVSVIGEVNIPGVHQLSGSKRLLEVISLSGGLKPDAGSEVIVTREPRWGGITGARTKLDPASGYTTASFSLDSLMSAKAPDDNILMRPNDVVSIPKAELIYVVGDVKKAGGFQLATHPTISLLQAVSLAEGLGPDHAAHHARILRPNPGGDGVPREIPVDVVKIFAGKAPDMQLYANDVLFIPHSGAKVTTRRALEAAIGISSGLLIYR